MVTLDALYLFAYADDPLLLLGLSGLGLAGDVILGHIFEVRQEVAAIDVALLFFLLLRGSPQPDPVDARQFEAKFLPVLLDAIPHDCYPLGELIVIHLYLDRLLLILTQLLLVILMRMHVILQLLLYTHYGRIVLNHFFLRIPHDLVPLYLFLDEGDLLLDGLAVLSEEFQPVADELVLALVQVADVLLDVPMVEDRVPLVHYIY